MTRSQKQLLVVSTIAALSIVILGFATSAHTRNGQQDDKTLIEKTLTGTWRGRWEEVLRTKFTTKTDSSPLWLQFKVERGKLVGQATSDYISLGDGPNPEVKMLVVGKKETSSLFDLRLNGNQLTFKRTLGQQVIESQLELVGEKEARLKIKRGEQFETWITLTHQF
ncbi:MAG: hypothetical protein AB1861_23710 [Cyanobacteriota bacterium]